ncbi:MAG: bacterial transcriptional activator domain-containing protein, partial [Gallionella sp.]|nr:bacterial transcriptional activator domain-containing protein [Gallionella sp.]
LDDRFCWVDVWALESLLAQVDAACIKTGTSRGAPDEAARLIEHAFELYRGDFLPGDDSSAWPLALRERLRSKFSRAIASLGNSLEQAGRWEKAAEVFRKGLEVDRGAEEFYQHLMVCYQRLGRRAEAVALYNRCRDILRESLGIAPSSRTEAVLQSLMAGD